MDAKQTPLIELLERVPADASPDPLHLSRILHELAGAASLCWTPHPSGVFDSQEAIKHVESAIAEIRERLAQPVQEPVAWIYRGNLHPFDPSDWAVEPVTPLYTTPQRREWVGLTDEDKQTAVWTNGTFGAGALWAEAKLRQENNG